MKGFVDFNLNEGAPALTNNVDLLLQQVELLFDTNVNDVLGDEDYGTNYDRYLYTLGMSNYSLEQKILNDLHKLDLFDFEPSVSVSIIEGTSRDIALIDITFSNDYEEYKKTYVIK